MRFALILAATLLGQCPGGVCRVSFAQAPAQFQRADISGKVWTSPDYKWLAIFVSQENEKLSKQPVTLVQPVARNADGTAVDPTKPAVEDPVGAMDGASKNRTLAIPKDGNYGIDLSGFPRVEQTGPWRGGNVGAPATPGATPDRSRIHLTLIGPEADAVLAKWRTDPAFAALERELGPIPPGKDVLAIQAYPRGSPLTAPIGIEDGGAPDIVIQTADGKPTFRDHRDPGVERIVGKVRELNPDYRPEKDPGSSSSLIPVLAATDLVLWLGGQAQVIKLGLGCIGGAFLFRTRKQA